VFKAEVGLGIPDYAAKRKIQESVYFVKNKAYRLSDIAMLYGFSTQSYFSATFKKYMGVSPGALRRQGTEG
jgi:AraC-like DNA-binding protein